MNNATFAQSQSFAMPQRTTFMVRVAPAFWNILLIGVAAILGVLYLVQVNTNMDKSYKIRDAQARISTLQVQARSNQVKLTEMETVSNLTAQASSMGMVPVGSVEYVSRPANGVAIR